jgi:hypothetical protein
MMSNPSRSDLSAKMLSVLRRLPSDSHNAPTEGRFLRINTLLALQRRGLVTFVWSSGDLRCWYRTEKGNQVISGA